MSKFCLAADSTQILAYLQCPQMWNFAYKRNLVHRYTPTDQMDKGTIMHGLLERYYHAIIKGGNFLDAQQFAIKELGEEIKKFKLTKDDFMFIKQRFVQYAIAYSSNDVTPLKVECGFSIPIYESNDFFFVLEGRIDMICTYRDGQRVIMDTKTQDREYYYHPKSIQFKDYCLASGINHGFINYIRWHKDVKENTFERKAFYFSNLELMRWKEKLITIFSGMAHTIMTKKYEKRLATCQNAGWGKPCEFMDICPEWVPNKQTRKGLTQIYYMKRPEWKPWELNGKSL